MLLCHEGRPGKSVGQRPWTDIGPNKRSLAAAHLQSNELRNGETHDPAGNSSTERRRCGLDSCTIVAPKQERLKTVFGASRSSNRGKPKIAATNGFKAGCENPQSTLPDTSDSGTSQPGIFTIPAGGLGNGAILHADFSLVSTASPANVARRCRSF